MKSFAYGCLGLLALTVAGCSDSHMSRNPASVVGEWNGEIYLTTWNASVTPTLRYISMASMSLKVNEAGVTYGRGADAGVPSISSDLDPERIRFSLQFEDDADFFYEGVIAGDEMFGTARIEGASDIHWEGVWRLRKGATTVTPFQHSCGNPFP